MAQLMPLPLTASCFSKIQIGFTFLVLAHPGSPGKRAVKRVCVHWFTNKAYLSAITMTNISQEFLPTRWRKKSTGIDTEQNYVTVTHSITTCASGPSTRHHCQCVCADVVRWCSATWQQWLAFTAYTRWVSLQCVQLKTRFLPDVAKCRRCLRQDHVAVHSHADLTTWHTHTHPFNGPFSGTTRVSRYQKDKINVSTRKVKPIWILLKQETVSGSGISWVICTSASRSRQITMPAPNHSVFLQAGCPSCRPTNSIKALNAKDHDIQQHYYDSSL